MSQATARPQRTRPQLEALLDLVSARVGIVRSLDLRMKNDDEPRFPLIYDSVLANYDFRSGQALERGACGKGFTEEAAMLGALGEAVEHYCGSHPAIKRIRRATLSQLGGEGVPPPEFVLYSENQYQCQSVPYAPWREEVESPWIAGIDLDTRKRCWVPATLVYLNYSGDQPQDALCPPTSSGLAAGPTLPRAIRSALIELIEREAFLVTWMNRLSVPTIAEDCLPGPLRSIWNTHQSSGTTIRFFFLPTDLPAFVVLAVALGNPPKPAAVIGLGCDTRLEGAIQRALFEVCQIYEPLRRKYEQGVANALHGYADVHTLEQHAGFFLRADHTSELEFLWRERRTLDLREVPVQPERTAEEELDNLLSALRASGCRGCCVELTTPDLCGYPIHVVRVLATRLQPIHFGHGRERLGGRRLFDLPRVLGYTAARTNEESLNPCPHPLA